MATAALLLPAALPADALAALADASQAPPPQRWFTVAVLVGAAGLAAAQQMSTANKRAQASSQSRLDITSHPELARGLALAAQGLASAAG